MKKIKTAEKRLVEIASLKKHIINYAKTKDVYVDYRKSGYSRKFHESHREAIKPCTKQQRMPLTNWESRNFKGKGFISRICRSSGRQESRLRTIPECTDRDADYLKAQKKCGAILDQTRQEAEKAQEEREKKKLKDKYERPGLAVIRSSGVFFLICGLLSGTLPQPSADLQFASVYQLLCRL